MWRTAAQSTSRWRTGSIRLGYAYRRLRQLDPAIQHYQQALALNPRHRSAHEHLGEAYLGQGDLAKAKEHLAVYPGNTEARSQNEHQPHAKDLQFGERRGLTVLPNITASAA